MPKSAAVATFAASPEAMDTHALAASDPAAGPRNARVFREPLDLAPGIADDSATFAPILNDHLKTLDPDIAARSRSFGTRSGPERSRDAISRFVADATAATSPDNVFTFKQVAAALTRLTVWAHTTKGYPLRYRLILSPDVVDLFQREQLADGEIRPGSVSNYRGYIRIAASAMGVDTSGTPAPINRDDFSPPYDREAIERFKGHARRGTRLVTVRANAVLALAAGAGVRGDELVSVRRKHILFDEELWVVIGGRHPRIIPVLPEWRPMLRRLTEQLAPDDLVYPRDENSRSDKLTKRNDPHHEEPDVRRLRQAWKLRHLELGTEIPHLLRWAAIAQGRTLLPLLPYLADGYSEDLRRTLLHTTIDISTDLAESVSNHAAHPNRRKAQ